MKKEMTYEEMTDIFREFERDNKSDKHLTGYIIFTKDSFKDSYSEESRTYIVTSGCKAFMSNMGGYSIYGSCLDGTDSNVRLEQYIENEHFRDNGWKVEKCYMIEDEN